MKPFLFALLAVAALAQAQPTVAPETSAGASVAAYKAKSPLLSRADYDRLLAHPEQVVVIDVRRPDEQASIGAFPVFLSIQAKDLEKNLDFIPRDRAVITVSNHAGRAGAAADLLAARGFKVAGAIGVQGYEAEGGTLVHVLPPPPRQAGGAPNAAPAAAATAAAKL
jgi:rhodanese-related sulfurtransferase